LDVDYCFYVIPKSSSFSFNLNRFNVATSRAKKSTFILVEKDFDRFVNLPNEVGNYLYKLKNEFTFSVNSNSGEFIKTSTNKSLPKISKDDSDTFNKKNLVDENVSNHSQYISQKSNNGIGLTVVGNIDLSKFERPKKEIVKGKENIYIIDTNVFVDQPDIISKIDQKYSVVLSAKVIDELDYLKISLTEEQKRNVQKALRLINESMGKRDIKMETADLNLLPNDFNKKSPDNFILSVALKFKGENPIMLTSDNGLQIKAKGLGVTTITLKDFLNQRKY
jgi:rRNA-processing protein FCF1